MPGAGEPERLREFWLRGIAEDGPGGLYVVELPDGGPVGALGLSVGSPRSRICDLTRLLVDPAVHRRGIGLAAVRLACRLVLVESDFHRLQAETYGDNGAGQQLFQAAGFTREGVRRRAYRRRGRWIDGVLYGILAEELPGEWEETRV